ncbi:MAG: DNA polymerase III subunit gamma/tau [Deltaproteobacteria bacterium]|nr:MAG: DNA polymerase III subunit gamma/tau [Deltaproteobacteria bacterium]
MTYEVLARKWRPQGFEDVIGQEHVTQTLVNAIKTGRLAHAYLFSGPRGVGKTSVARILAKAINCEKGEPGKPCNQCQVCEEITSGSSVDVQEIDGASNRGIDEIRELRGNINYMPSSSRYRVYIIDEVHMLTLPAFNALLKTLEEPPPHVKFIFATTEPHKVPVTILSRCQRFDFKRIPLYKIVEHLQNISRQEGIEISKTSLSLIAKEADGGMRDAESLLDQVVSFSGTTVEDKQVTDILGIIDREILFQLSGSIVEGDMKKCLEILDQVYKYGYDMKAFYRSLMQQIRDLLISLIARENDLVEISENDRGRVREQAEKAGRERLQIILNFLMKREENLRFTTDPRLLLEAVILQLCQMGDFLSFGEIIDRVEGLEKMLSGRPVTRPSPDIPRLSDPEAHWQGKETHGSPEDLQPSSGKSEWKRFLSFLSSKNRAMAKVLEEWELKSLSKDSLALKRGNRSFSTAYFDDAEKLDQLRVYCREFFGQDIRISLQGSAKSVSRNKAVDPPKAKKKSVAPQQDFPPPVKDILDVFQGKVITGESPRKPTSD